MPGDYKLRVSEILVRASAPDQPYFTLYFGHKTFVDGRYRFDIIGDRLYFAQVANNGYSVKNRQCCITQVSLRRLGEFSGEYTELHKDYELNMFYVDKKEARPYTRTKTSGIPYASPTKKETVETEEATVTKTAEPEKTLQDKLLELFVHAEKKGNKAMSDKFYEMLLKEI